MKTVIYLDGEDDIPVAVLELAVLPKIGERMFISGIDIENQELSPLGNEVMHIAHFIHKVAPGRCEHFVKIVLRLFAEPKYMLEVLWEDAAHKPEWWPEDFLISTDYIPRTGEIITIGRVDPSTWKREEHGFVDDLAVEDRVTVEITAVSHGSYYEYRKEDYDAGFGMGDLETQIYVRATSETPVGDVLRVIDRSRKN